MKLFSSGDLSRDHYLRDDIQEIHNLRGFLKILRKFFIFHHEIFVGSKILPIFCDIQQKFDYGYPSYPGNETQSPDFGRFWIPFGIFRPASCEAFSLEH